RNTARQGGHRPREQTCPGNSWHPKDLVAAEGELEFADRDVPGPRLMLVELADSRGIAPQLRGRVCAGVALEEADGDERRHGGGEHDAEHEQRREPEAQ